MLARERRFSVLPELSWVKVKAAAAKEHGGVLDFHVAEAADSTRDAHDLAVDLVCHGLGDSMHVIADHVC
jgi:hypothetical protein